MNKVILIILFTTFLQAISWSSQAQSSPEEIIKKFFTEYKSIGTVKAIDNLYATNKWMSNAEAKESIDNLKEKLAALNEDYVGKYYGYELLSKKAATESFVLYSYIAKFDRQPIRFIFQFYKPNDQWAIYSFSFDADIDDEIKRAAQLDLNKK